MLAGFAPSGRVNRGYSDSPQRHRRAGLELQERSAAVAPVTTSLTSVSQGHGMPKRGHSCSSAGGLRSRYGLTPSFPGTLTRCFLTWPELLRPSIARRAVEMDNIEVVVDSSALPAGGSAPVGSIVWRYCRPTGPPEAYDSVEVHSWGLGSKLGPAADNKDSSLADKGNTGIGRIGPEKGCRRR